MNLLTSALSNRWSLFWMSGCLILLCCLASGEERKGLSQTHNHPVEQQKSMFSKRGAILHSSLPDNEVRVPFFMREKSLLVKAIVAGKSVDCQIDTGASGITWPRALGFKGKTIAKDTTYRWMDGRIHHSQEIRLPTILIGDYELKDKITVRTNEPSNVMILGTLAFKEVALTIDWQKKQLILRSPHYNTGAVRPDKNHFVTDFVWHESYKYTPGVPVFALTVEGHPAHCVFDTGNPNIDFTPTFGRKYLRNKTWLKGTVERGFTGSPEQKIDCVADVHFAFAGVNVGGEKIYINIRTLACFGLGSSYTFEGSFGAEIYKYLRTTIDYPHRKLLFEKYPADATQTLPKS